MKENFGSKADTGRPGRAAATTSLASIRSTVPAHSPTSRPPAGYEPESLDRTLAAYIGAIERSIETAKTLGDKVETAVTALLSQMTGTPEEQAELLTRLHERLSKANLNLVKSTDELTRLRSFLAGGPDRREDITVKGELDLRMQLVAAIQQLGWRVVDEKGAVIEVAA